MINLDEADIIQTLSSNGENYITTATATNLSEAFNAATANFPFQIDGIDKLLIQFRYGLLQPNISDINKISSLIGSGCEHIEIIWGLSHDPSLGKNFEIVILASL